MPYWQYMKLQQAETCKSTNGRGPVLSLDTSQYKEAPLTTGITPMVEQNISFCENPSTISNSNATNSFEGTLEERNSDKHALRRTISVKRPASPSPIEMNKKRTKSGEEGNAPKVFQESSDWE